MEKNEKALDALEAAIRRADIAERRVAELEAAINNWFSAEDNILADPDRAWQTRKALESLVGWD